MVHVSQIFNDFYSVREELLQLPRDQWQRVVTDVTSYFQHTSQPFPSQNHFEEFEKFTKILCVSQLQELVDQVQPLPITSSFFKSSKLIERRLDDFAQYGYEMGWESIPDFDEMHAFAESLECECLRLAFNHFHLIGPSGVAEVNYWVEQESLCIQVMSPTLPHSLLNGIGSALQTFSQCKLEHNRCTRIKAVTADFSVSLFIPVVQPI